MFQIAVCDSVPAYNEKLADCIENWAVVRQTGVQVRKFVSGEEVLFDLENTGDFAAVFIDVELSGMDGMETAVRVRERNRIVSIVFVTCNEEYLRQMCRRSELYPWQYIDKPVSDERVFDVLDHVIEEHRRYFESFMFQYNRVHFNISLGDVFYFVSDRRRVKIFLESGKEYSFYGKLDVLEEKIVSYSHHFVRIHQSYLVNARQIEKRCLEEVMVRNGDVLPISRKRRGMVGSFYMVWPGPSDKGCF